MLHIGSFRALALVILVVVAIALPTIAVAQTSSVADLVAQIEKLQAQIAALKAQRSTTSPPPTTSTSCPTLARTLSRGATGADVSALQQFLIAQGHLTSDSATGFFGALTEKAIQTFQARQGVVSSGTPASTGYGLVGVKTRVAIGLACIHTNSSANASIYMSQGSSTPKAAPPSSLQPNCPLVALPIGRACIGNWKEVKDAKGCTASWQCEAK